MVQKNENYLPALDKKNIVFIENIIKNLGIPREIVASDDEISHAWKNLPRELESIPDPDELVAKMCMATATGLFDAAINYMWNATIKCLRKHVIDFGLNVVSQIIDKPFDEKDLNNLKDSELLDNCLELNLISEEGHFKLSHCRDLRNYFSAAHHSSYEMIDDRELIYFVSCCIKYVLNKRETIRGIDLKEFLKAITSQKLSQDALDIWNNNLKNTHDKQRELIFVTLHGIYCDPSSKEQSRINALSISKILVSNIAETGKSRLLDAHYKYQKKGNKLRLKASETFFTKLQLTNLLNDIDKHAIIYRKCRELLSVHQEFNNFHNEPFPASELLETSQSTSIPDATLEFYVTTVLTCYIGNSYGISWNAVPHYETMIKNFTPKAIRIMLDLEKIKCLASERMKAHKQCKNRYLDAVKLINRESISSYPEIIKQYSKLIGQDQ